MNGKWKYYDIMDLEYFFQDDDDVSEAERHERDRRIYLDEVGSPPAVTEPTTDELLSAWLKARRRQHGDHPPLPGTLARETHGLLRLLLILSGLFCGSAGGLAFFSYSGTTPVNVLHFLALFVFSQIALAAALLVRAGLVRLGLHALPPSLVLQLLGGLAARLVARLVQRSGSRLSAQQRLAGEAFLGRIRATGSTLPALLAWPLFRLTQLFGACFNLGLLAATLFRILVSDMAFGWQSTLQISAPSLHGFVKWLALPWSWLFPAGTGYPTLAEIEGSRIILKEGIANLQTPDLISWWPFLLLSVLVYGLLLRLLLLGYGRLGERRSQNHPAFRSPAARQVLRRMQNPVVSSQAPPEPDQRAAAQSDSRRPEEPHPASGAEQAPVIVLVPDEIFELCSRDELAKLLGREGYGIRDIHRFMVDYHSDHQLLARLDGEAADEPAAIVILMEAWLPPLVAFQSFLHEMRQRIGTLPIILRLVGKPSAGTALTPVTDAEQSRIWRQKMAAMGDPRLTSGELIAARNR